MLKDFNFPDYKCNVQNEINEAYCNIFTKKEEGVYLYNSVDDIREVYFNLREEIPVDCIADTVPNWESFAFSIKSPYIFQYSGFCRNYLDVLNLNLKIRECKEEYAVTLRKFKTTDTKEKIYSYEVLLRSLV